MSGMPSTAGDLGAEVYETHTGLVALIGAQAFKVKKPVVTDFLDFSSPQRREDACRREVELNRRLASSSYLGVGHFRSPAGDTEPVIVMRRYPDDERLSALVRADVPVERWLVSIADIVARFHVRAERGPSIDREATPAVLGDRWQQNLTELRRHAGTVLADEPIVEVERLATQYLAGREPLFAARIAARRIIDGHGDLLSQDIFCTEDGPVLLDCLEFDDRLRYVDGIDDAAFLAMDLEFLGRPDLATLFLDEYCSRAADLPARSLRDFCIAYRAIVRTKVDCVRVDQGHPDAAAEARRHLSIALSHLRSASVKLIVVGGGPGTGKTTVANGLAEKIGAQVISTDEVRRELSRGGQVQGRVGELDTGLYAPENVSAVYDEVLHRARTWLGAGHSVIVDGTWRDDRHRRRAHAVAAETYSEIVELRCALTVSEARRRIVHRTGSASDATPAMAAELTGWEADWSSAHPIDTGGSPADSVAEAYRVCVNQ